MPNNIYHKRNANSGIAPTASQLTVGEIALNTADGKAYTRTTAGTVVELTEPSVADGGEQFSPLDISNLALWLDASDTGSLYTTDAGPVTAVNSPLDVAGCVGWWDAGDTSSVTQSGGIVSQWNDKSGSGLHLTQDNLNFRPGVATVNGLQAIDFDGADDFLACATEPPDFATILSVHVCDVTGVGQTMHSFQRGAGVTLKVATLIYSSTNEYRAPHFLGSTGYSRSGGTLTAGAPSLAASVFDGSAVVLRVRGAGENGTTNQTGANVAGVFFGARNLNGVPGVYLNGKICEVLVFSSVLSLADLARIEAYLAAKWGISQVHAQTTTTSAPVGQWRDKSGNTRHVVQAVSANRPTRATVNGRAALTFNGTTYKLTHTPSSEIGANELTSIAVVRTQVTELAPVFFEHPCMLTAGNNGRPIDRHITRPGSGGQNRIFVGTSFSDVVSPVRNYTTQFIWHVDGKRDGVSSGTHQLREFLNGANLFTTSVTAAWLTTNQKINVGMRDDNGVVYSGDVCEVIIYDKLLTTTERQKLESYLATKWGITLAPPVVSNADAQDWVQRVYANGGTVSLSTAAAVNNFCNAIDAAGIRDRFYRLNLFCGDNLNACLVPLYRGPSLGGTQFGNATDTNNNFIASDYNERGTNGGLKGNGSNKVLLTGLYRNSLPVGLHMGCFVRQRNVPSLGAFAFYTAFDLEQGAYSRGGINNDSNVDATRTVYFNNSATNLVAATPFELVSGDFVLGCTAGSGANLTRAFLNGTVVVTQTGYDSSSVAARFTIFARVIETTQATQFPSNARIGGYTIGSNLTDAEAAAYSTIWDTFLRTLGRR